MDIFDLVRGRPISNAVQLGRVHFNVSMGEYHPKVVDLGDTEFTLFDFEV